MPRRAPDTPTLREQALDVALELLHLDGYSRLSMEGVAARVGVRKASLYYHFPGGRDELMLAMAHRLLREHRRGFEGALASSESARESLEALCRWMFAQRGESHRLLRQAARDMPQAHQGEVYQGFLEGLYLPIHRTLERGIERGEFRPHDTRLSAWMLLGLLSEMSVGEQAQAPQLAERMLELFVSGIGPPA